MLNSLLRTLILAGFLLGVTSLSFSHSSIEKNLVGEPAKATKSNKLIKVTTLDSMRFIFSEKLVVHDGEVVTFEITNAGKVVHEFSIGTEEEQKEHQKMMRSMPGMIHEDGNTITIKPGETKWLTWKFKATPKHNEVVFACNIPGHFEAGMYEKVKVIATKP
ncbi:MULTISPECIES: cupredoxin domain-containing protein [Legionella]|uniref:cupredoxin domain-containing protein n=1 Tax=Legionella TaxID=445 RepID=UPI001A256212|nr:MULTISPECIES: plastocyanin/azurin family copper-binding protein [Legionella]MDO5215679.1 plastocyanin/azurin family copper-binding protein [Legionella pneumophila]MDX1838078.1 plastocyanin/azurin family copper-binding protein [Legionella taurinensis]HAU1024995.1 hypothetical protein [Legionella pneumophila]